MTLAVERSESFYFLRSSFLALFLAFNALVSVIQHCKLSLSQNFLIAVDISGLDKKLSMSFLSASNSCYEQNCKEYR